MKAIAIESVVLQPYVDWHDNNKLALHARINLNRNMPWKVYKMVERNPHRSIVVQVFADYLPFNSITHNMHGDLEYNPQPYVDKESGSLYQLDPIRWPLSPYQSVTYHADIKPFRAGGHVFGIKIDTYRLASEFESIIPGQFMIKFRLV